MNQLQKYSAFTLIVTFVCFSLIGIALLPKLTVKQVPENDLLEMTVSFNMGNMSPRVVEDEATSKIEQVLSRIEGIKYVNSVSNTGSGIVTLGFIHGTNMATARLQAATAIRQVWDRLPTGISYPRIMVRQSDKLASSPFLRYAICADTSIVDMQHVVDDKIISEIGQISGIKTVKQNETAERVMTAVCDSRQMQAAGITMQDIQEAMTNCSYEKPLGMEMVSDFDGKKKLMRINMAADGDRSLNLSKTKIRTANGQLVSIDSFVKIADYDEEPVNMERINGLKTVFVDITAEHDANQVIIGEKVKKMMKAIEKSLPHTFEVHLENDSSSQLSHDLQINYTRSALTVLILILFTFISTRNKKLAIVVLTSLIISLCIAVGIYYIAGIEIHFYTLAGITISLNLMIDNVIVMAYHIISRNNIKAFMPMLAATLTSIGALSIIFFLDYDLKLNLVDFSMAIIINLVSSLFTATFFVPALMEKMGVQKHALRYHQVQKCLHNVMAFNRVYAKATTICLTHRKAVFTVTVLTFGLPVFLLPMSIDCPSNWWEKLYNQTVGNSYYCEQMRSTVDKILGGTLRFFVDNAGHKKGINTEAEETGIGINVHIGEGGTLQQVNNMIKPMEAFLTREKGIQQFHTYITGPNDGNIWVSFSKEAVDRGIPVSLHHKIVKEALTIGGGSWSVGGPGQMEFSNDARMSAGDIEVWLRGYNYDQLNKYANEFRNMLLKHPRIKSVVINSARQKWNEKQEELYLDFDKHKLAKQGITITKAVAALRNSFGNDKQSLSVLFEGNAVTLVLKPSSSELNTWAFTNLPIHVDGKVFKVNDVASVEKRQMADAIVKNDQEYLLCIQFDYIGDLVMGYKIIERDIKQMQSKMVMGYSIKQKTYSSIRKEHDGWKNILLLGVVIVIVFFITSILFNSLRQPFAILLVIPLSFIGVFLAFGALKLNFGEGGFASLVLLAGISVNSNIYIVNEYNNIRRIRPKLSAITSFIKAWNRKVTPIMLTVLSTIIGFIPFVIAGDNDFWLSLAVGTISGLLTSVVGSFMFLPLLLCRNQRSH